MSITSRDRKLLALLAVVGVIAAYWFFAFKPMQAETSKLKTKVEKKQSELKSAEQQIKTYSAAQVTYTTDYSSMVRLGVAIPEDDAVPSLLVQLDSLAGKDVDFTVSEVVKYPETLLASSMIPTANDALGIPLGGGDISELIGKASSTASMANAKAQAPPPGTGNSGPKNTFAKPAAEDSTAGPEAEQIALPFEPIELRLQFQGNYFKLNRVIAGIEKLVQMSGKGQAVVGGRLLFVEGFKMKAGRNGFPDVSFDVGALAFSLPQGEGLTGGATPQAPQQGGPQTVSNNGSPPSPSTTNATSGK